MNPENERVIGIVGGMGPQAGLALFDSIMRQTESTTDQEHLSAILMSFPKHIVDRTAFLEGEVKCNPAFGIVEVIQKLERAGANVIGVSCNTSHVPGIFDIIVSELDRMNSTVKLLHMPAETCACIKEKYPHAQRVGVMATNGTYRYGIYHALLQHMGYEVLMPEYGFQCDVIHKMIYDREFGLKSNAGKMTGAVKDWTKRALQYFDRRGADTIILACTDLSLLLTSGIMKDRQVIDSTASLARALIREATVRSTTITTWNP